MWLGGYRVGVVVYRWAGSRRGGGLGWDMDIKYLHSISLGKKLGMSI